MSEILGHDCDGRPLRAGDVVMLVRRPTNSNYKDFCMGRPIVVTGAPGSHSTKGNNLLKGRVEVDVPDPDGEFSTCPAWALRKLPEQKQSDASSFRDMIHRLNTEDMTKRNKELGEHS